MKILIVTPTYYPDVNGAAYFAQRLAQYLRKREHGVLVIAPSRSMRHETYESDGVSVFGIRSFPVFINNFRIAQSFFVKELLCEKIKDFSPDVIHLQSHFLFNKTAMNIAKELKIPLIGTNHFMPENLIHYLPLPKKAKKYIRKLAWNQFLDIFKKLDIVTTPTQTGSKMLKEIGFSKEVHSLSNGIDLNIFNPKNDGQYLRQKYHLPENPLILYLGRLDREKNINLLIEAFAQALKKIDAHFVIAGIGAEEKNLKKTAERLNIANSVTFTGFVSNEDKPNLYTLADCFVIAGIAELQSIATMEAMASGLPIIAVNAMALPHLVKHGKNGFLFKLEDVPSVAKYIIQILSNRALRDKMSQKSLEMIKEHDINASIFEFESLYQSLIDKYEKSFIKV